MFKSLFGSAPTTKITWKNQESLAKTKVKLDDDRYDTLYLFSTEDDIAGKVDVIMPGNTKKIEHNGIKAELIGQIELPYDNGNHFIVVSDQIQLCGQGILTKDIHYDFNFENKSNKKEYETYNGVNVKLRYFIRVRIIRSYQSVSKEFDFVVNKVVPSPTTDNKLTMEVGIEDCLHIEFKYDKSKYHLNDVITGRINFLLVRIKIKHMELQILKKESTGISTDTYNDTQVVTKFEIMDGAPIKGEQIPIRLFLEPYSLTPTFNIDLKRNKFSVKYFLNLVLVDEEDRRYFKQQEINLWRKTLDNQSSQNTGTFGGTQVSA